MKWSPHHNLPSPKAENEVHWIRWVGFSPVFVHEALRIKQLWLGIHLLVPSHRPVDDMRAKHRGIDRYFTDQMFGIIVVSAGISYPLYWSSFIDR
jgi:hypothetical protein